MRKPGAEFWGLVLEQKALSSLRGICGGLWGEILLVQMCRDSERLSIFWDKENGQEDKQVKAQGLPRR